MTGFCRLIYIKTSEDLACAFPNVYRETWRVKSLLSDSYSETSVSSYPLSDLPWDEGLTRDEDAGVPVPRGCFYPQLSPPPPPSHSG